MQKKTVNLKITLLLALGIFHLGYAQNPYSKLESDLQGNLNKIVKEKGIPGITFSLLLDGKHQINLASGYSDFEKKAELDPLAKMLSGSTGKLFFSTIALKMIQEGQLGLDDKVLEYLGSEEWYKTFPNHSEIRIKNLLNHTSGLPRHLFQPEFLEDFIKNPLSERAPEDCIQSISNKPAVHPVGRGWAYSDTNYILLGLIIEKITAKNIYDLVDAELIKPLALHLTVPSNTLAIDGLAQGHIGPQNPFQLPSKVLDANGNLVLNPSFEWTGGGFATNPADLTKLVRYIHESSYLNEETKKQLISAVSMTTGEPYDNGYGLGSFIWSKMEDERYGHSGFFPGYVSHVEYSKNRQYAIAIQINDDGAYPLMQQILYEMELTIEKHLGGIDEFKIRQNFAEQEKCWNQEDIECYMQAYATSEPIQTASTAGVTYGYDDIIGGYKKYFPKGRMGKLHFDNISTRRLSDNLYFVTGRFNLKFPGRDDLAQGWFSVNMKRINGDWKMITDHSS
ncbi:MULTISPECIES: serine hydrolase [Flavobacteriaceae]|uniref:serine hydrolase n=1 Tax=Flavobacteriaceae TaxID=49546 RepID=UPI002349E641|nr:serine hydrolase [Muricauda sp. SP22]MDC6363759.1 serine hydrolase [Muricauda sp. SP22]